MPKAPSTKPRSIQQAMVSSTFTDLRAHREALIKALNEHDLHPNVMEYDSAKPVGDVIDSSLQMVRDSAAYILVISRKYGQTPECSTRNPNKLSITELEFNEAQQLNRPTLLYIMGDEHDIKIADIERDAVKEEKLNAFRERAKIDQVSKVNRVYAVFESLAEFKDKLPSSLQELRNHLEQDEMPSELKDDTTNMTDSQLPVPPAFYAAPVYIGRTTFIGRKAELQLLSAWAQAADKTSVLLFEAIGGNGKSMLTWEWTTKHATGVRGDWAGRFWYSFYEKGAVMRGFCQHALAYMTQQPLEAFEKKSTAEMRVVLLAELRKKPWLLILDGLERVLVAYHRIDAAEVRDEELNRPTDNILDRNACDAIRDEDTDLLRALSAAAPSKILISSRLIPRVLLNQASLPIPGVTPPLKLPGLEDADAEALLHSCGVKGTSADIRYYLKTYCDNHPLVISVLAGLINSPGPHRGNFDTWAADPAYGVKLNLASLDLIQSRNHILQAAMEALEPASRQLLSTLAMLSGAADYETVAAFNPHLPPRPVKVKVPSKPEDGWLWKRIDDENKAKLRGQYEAALAKRNAYELALHEWRESGSVREAPQRLTETMADLEHRSLLQYDPLENRYDLHPVVRGVAAGNLNAEDMESYGQKVVDYFNSKPHNSYDQAKSMADVEAGLQVMRTLLKLGHHQQAADALDTDLTHALLINLEAHVETLALLRPFFRAGWDQLPKGLDTDTASVLANTGALCLCKCGDGKQAIGAYAASLDMNLEMKNWRSTTGNLNNIAQSLFDQNRLAQSLRASALVHDFACANKHTETIFTSRLLIFADRSRLGQWPEAEATWQRLDPMGRRWNRSCYRQGDAEWCFAQSQFWQGILQEEQIRNASTLAEQDHNRVILRALHMLRGSWRLEQGDWTLAAASFTQAVTMAREARLIDASSETGLLLAKIQLRQLTRDEARNEAQRLAQLREPAHRSLARLWQMLGDLDQAKHHALASYTWAWADGEPYVNRYELTKTTELLHELGVPIPNLPPYDPANDEPFPWEAEVRAAIEKIRAEKAAKKKAEQHGEVKRSNS
jgi:hypothetical protein